MDRNVAGSWPRGMSLVALRKESVDRNGKVLKKETGPIMSLSARRAWIEISLKSFTDPLGTVALRKESVDRNNLCAKCVNCGNNVALRKESVDRNANRLDGAKLWFGRSPQGERG